MSEVIVRFECGNCGFETKDLKEFTEHIKKDDWYCWYKENGGWIKVEKDDTINAKYKVGDTFTNLVGIKLTVHGIYNDGVGSVPIQYRCKWHDGYQDVYTTYTEDQIDRHRK